MSLRTKKRLKKLYDETPDMFFQVAERGKELFEELGRLKAELSNLQRVNHDLSTDLDTARKTIRIQEEADKRSQGEITTLLAKNEKAMEDLTASRAEQEKFRVKALQQASVQASLLRLSREVAVDQGEQICLLRRSTEALASLTDAREHECCICLGIFDESGHHVHRRCANCVAVIHYSCLPDPKDCPVCLQSFVDKVAASSDLVAKVDELFCSDSDED